MENLTPQGIMDDETFKKAVLDYRERIFLLILRFTRNRDDARDLTQDAFLRAYRSRHLFRGQSSIYTWIYRIAINLALNYKTRDHFSSNISLEDAAEIYGDSNPSSNVLDNELRRNIDAAVSTLPARQKMVFILRYYEDKPHHEIAEFLGITEGAVKANYHQAIKKLRKELRTYVGGDA